VSYKETEVLWGGKNFIFVTRGRSKPFTAEEAIQYLTDRTQKIAKSNPTVGSTLESFLEEEKLLEPTLDLEPEVEESPFEAFIPDDKHRKLMFLKDYSVGIEFCSKKYGVSSAQVIAEVKRIAPHMNVGG
jgi:hypothetical protein